VECPDITAEIAAQLPLVFEAMPWYNKAYDFQKDLEDFPNEWILMKDSEGGRVVAVAREKISQNGMTSTLSWVGFTTKNPQDYTDFFMNYFDALGKSNRSDSRLWNKVSVTLNFEYIEEWRTFYKPLVVKLDALDILHERVLDVEHLRSKLSKIIVYPISSEINPHGPFETKPNYTIERYQDPKKLQEQECTDYLEKVGLADLFLKVAFGLRYCDETVKNKFLYDVIDEFKKSPECFFVYTIGGVAQGYVHFQKNKIGGIAVIGCGMDVDHLKYADHLFSEFINWAMTKKKDPALTVDFNVDHYMPRELENAIENFN
jgi:hypothetical protein